MNSGTVRKLAVWFGIMLFGILAGRQMREDPPKGPTKLEVALGREVDSLRRAVVAAQAMLDRTAPKANQAAAIVRDTREAIRQRKAQAASLPALSDTVSSADSLLWLRQRADTLHKLYATCSVQADSLTGAAERLLGAYRECALATGKALDEAVKAEGLLNQARARLGVLEARPHSPFRLGLTAGAVGGLDRAGGWYGPGACFGALVGGRVPLVGLRVGLCAGGVAGLAPTGEARVGVGLGGGIPVRLF